MNLDLATAPIRIMRPKIVDRLRLVFPERDFTISAVPSVMTIDEFKRITRTLPFIGIAWMGMTVDRGAGRQLTAVMNWRLMLVVKASSNLDARFEGDSRDIGLDAMVDVATAALHFAELPHVGHASVTSAQAVFADGWADEATVIAYVDFAIRFATSLARISADDLDSLRLLGVAWLLDGQPEGSPQISDEVSIPQGDDE